MGQRVTPGLIEASSKENESRVGNIHGDGPRDPHC